MTFLDLEDGLKTGPDGRLRVDGSALSTSVASLFADFLSGRVIEFQKAHTKPDKFKDGNQELESVYVAGTLDAKFLGLSSPRVEAWFFLINGDAEVVMTFPEMPDLSQSFQKLADRAAFSQCLFTLDSRRPNALGDDFNAFFSISSIQGAKRGLYLSANLQVAKVDETLSQFGIQNLTVAGSVELADDIPRMRLAAKDPVASFEFHGMALKLAYEYLTAPVVGLQKTRERLSTTLAYQSNNANLTIPLALTRDPTTLPESLIIESSTGLSSLVTLETLLGFLSAEIKIPADFPLKNLSLTQLSIEVGFGSGSISVREVRARVEVLGEYPIIEYKKLLTFENPGLEFTITNYGDEWQVQPYLTGKLKLAGGGTLTGVVDLDAKSFFCVLDDDSQLDLKNLLEETFELRNVLPRWDRFDLTRFEISGNMGAKRFALDIGTSMNWPLDLGATSVSIEELFLSLEYADSSFAGALGGSLRFGGATAGIVAKYDAAGLAFEMMAYNIAITDLFASVLGDMHMADELPKVVFPALELKVAPSTGAFSFRGAAETVWEKPFGTDASFSCNVNLQLERQVANDREAPVACKIEIRGEGKFTVNQQKLDAKIFATAKNDRGPLDVGVGGKLNIENLEFELFFGKEAQVQTFLATYHGEVKISIDKLLRQVFAEPITTGVELTLKDALFGCRGDEEGAKYLFGLKIGIDIGLAKLPVVGPALPPELQVGIEDLQILAATRAFRLQEVKDLNRVMPAGVTKLPTGKPDGGDMALQKGLNVSAKLKLGGTDKLLMLPAGQANTSAPQPGNTGVRPAAEAPRSAAAPPAARKWFDIQKSLGPLRLERLGVEYKEQRLGILFDAGMDLLGVRLDLLGLSISLPLSNPRPEDLAFGLDGLELSVKQKPLEISGALLRVYPTDQDISLQYDGRVLVRAEVFSLAALGSYAVIRDQPSLFIFAVLHKELGGPAFFFVTGLAFGFGVNRLLKLPAIGEVQNFPLIKGATDPEYFGSDATPRTALQKLQEYIPPSVGDYWLAAGVKFNSFGMIDSFAMLSVSFGTQFQIAILGLSRISVPKQLPGAAPIDPVACAELAIKVTFTLSTGLLAAEARLTENSFVFSKECKLRGGFALYCWFGPEHAGDFVVTLGGYHPKFVPPAHYPIVPRLGMNWRVGENLALSGELYFALTPSCLMAGGKLSAVYQAGPLRAWFYAGADFLINWQPFAYDIEMGVRIGLSYVLSALDTNQALTIEIGAQLHMWGPPFGGLATVTLYIISFDISFGAPQQPVLEKVEWEGFQQSFLPQAEETGADPLLCTIRITSGLIKTQEVTKNGKKSSRNIVNAHELSFTTESVVPATSVLLNNKPVEAIGLAPRLVGIRPMDIKALTSVHAVSVETTGQSENGWAAYLAPTLITKNVPDALWSNSGLIRVDRPGNEMIEAVPNGVRVGVRTREPSHGLAPIELEKFKYERIPKDIAWEEWQPPVPIPAPGDRTFANTIWNNPTVDAARKAILTALGKENTQIDLRNLAAASTEIFQSEPDMAALGEPFKQPLFAG